MRTFIREPNGISLNVLAFEQDQKLELTGKATAKFNLSTESDLNQSLYDPYKPTTETLANGATLIMAPNPKSETTAVVISIKAGSIHDEPSGSGLAHLLEHCLINSSHSITGGITFKEWFQNKGYIENAATSSTATRFEIYGRSDHIHEAAEVLHRMIFEPFVAQELTAEKNIISDEREKFPGGYSVAILKLVRALEDGAPLLAPVIGFEKTFTNLKNEDLRKFHKSHYIASKVNISVTGNISPQLAKTIRSLAGEITTATDSETIRTNPQQPLSDKDRLYVTYIPNRMSFYSMHLAVPGQPDSMQLVDTIIYNRLNDRVRELSPIYNLNFTRCYTGNSLSIYRIEFCTANTQYNKVRLALGQTVKELIDNPPTPGELKRAQLYLVASLRKDQIDDSTHSKAIDFHKRITGSEALDINREIKQINSITTDEAHQAIKKILTSPHQIVEEQRGSILLHKLQYFFNQYVAIFGALMNRVSSFFSQALV